MDNKQLLLIAFSIVVIIIIIGVYLFNKHSEKRALIFISFSLIIATIGFLYIAFFHYKPIVKKLEKTGVIYPFSAKIEPDWDGTSSTNGIKIERIGDAASPLLPAISCPEGYGIDIIAAFLEVDDPYSQCSVTPDPLLQVTCGYTPTSYPDKVGDCKTDADCSVGTICSTNAGASKNKCVPKPCKQSEDCGSGKTTTYCNKKLGMSCKLTDTKIDGLICVAKVLANGNTDTSYTYVADPAAGSCMACIDNNTGTAPVLPNEGVCVLMPDCMNVNSSVDINYDGLNNTCSAKGYHKDLFKCRPRDASAYLAHHCNGETICLGGLPQPGSLTGNTWMPLLQDGAFGPLPCQLEPGGDDYKTLPVNIGKNPSKEPSFTASYNQGYKVNGIYSCILKKTE